MKDQPTGFSLNFHIKTAFPGIAVLLILLLSSFNASAQDTLVVTKDGVLSDTSTVTYHSPHKATIYSLVLPGLGQAYNKKYWKIPIIYAGFGYFGYSIKINHVEMKKFTEAYRYISNNETYSTDNPYIIKYPNTSDLLSGRDFYRRKVELNIIYSAALYLLNVVDAAVDAHFFDYDVSDNLALRLDPVIIPSQMPMLPHSNGIRLSLNFK
ncbi:MAG: DUF5683 domain-containing protein [Lentimicrobium sp.]|jgi:hypothetical protein|nr:DUF5683 domain-containing protein [Lentimicrobium sp.]